MGLFCRNPPSKSHISSNLCPAARWNATASTAISSLWRWDFWKQGRVRARSEIVKRGSPINVRSHRRRRTGKWDLPPWRTVEHRYSRLPARSLFLRRSNSPPSWCRLVELLTQFWKFSLVAQRHKKWRAILFRNFSLTHQVSPRGPDWRWRYWRQALRLTAIGSIVCALFVSRLIL